MAWKKNGFSYLIWFVYTMITGTALVSLGSSVCVEAGFLAWWGIGAVALYLMIVGGLVLLLHRTADKRIAFAEKHRILVLLVEAVLVIAMLAGGVILRVYRIGEPEGNSVYFAMAEVVAGQRIPQIVHGAVYFYVQLLHGVLLLVGNQALAGVWLQVVLQLLACVGLYFLVRRLAGRVAALTSFGFCMFAPYMLESGLELVPDMLYLLLFVAAALLAAAVSGEKRRFLCFLVIGILSALCCYVDISGLLLFLFGIGLAFAERERRVAFRRKLTAAGLCGLGLVAGFVVSIGADAFISGKGFLSVVKAWFALYQPEAFRLPVTLGAVGYSATGLAMAGLMAFGIFAFWRDRKRDGFLFYVIAACAVMAGCCFGIFTEEMPGFLALYLLFAVLAGISLERSACAVKLPELSEGNVPEMETSEDGLYEDVTFEEGQVAETSEKTEEKKVKYLDNPLPLPKKHVKRALDYSIQILADDDFDYPIGEADDFDI